jgi:hypothetical protein
LAFLVETTKKEKIDSITRYLKYYQGDELYKVERSDLWISHDQAFSKLESSGKSVLPLQTVPRFINALHVVRRFALSQSKIKPIDDDDLMQRPLRSDEESFRQFRYTVDPVMVNKYGIRVAQGLNLIKKCINYKFKRKQVQWSFETVERMLYLTDHKSLTALKLTIKEFSTLNKTFNSIIKGSKDYVDRYVFGFEERTDGMEEDVRNWLTGTADYEEKKKIDDDTWYSRFGEYADMFMDRNFSNRSSKTQMALEEWLKYPANWAKSGASSIKHFHTATGIKFKKTKWSSAIFLDYKTIYKTLQSGDWIMISNAVSKSEALKNRKIVASDLMSYISGAYAVWVLELFNIKGVDTTMYFTANQKYELFKKFNEDSGHYISMPVDQVKFDHNYSFKMNDILLKCLKKKMSKMDLLPDVQSDVMLQISILMQKTKNHKINTIIDGKLVDTFISTKGLPSGIKMTALFGSITSWCFWRMAIRYYIERTKLSLRLKYDDIVVRAVTQGDDVGATVKSWFHAENIARCFVVIGAGINESKTVAHDGVNEYLRIVTNGTDISGYAARGMNKIFWLNKSNRRLPPSEEEFSSIVNKWSTVMGRGFPPRILIKYMILDLAHRHRLTRGVVLQMLRTPASVGGIGFKYLELERDPSKWMKFKYEINDNYNFHEFESLPGIKVIDEFWMNRDHKPRDVFKNIADAIVENAFTSTYSIKPYQDSYRSKVSNRLNKHIYVLNGAPAGYRFILNFAEKLGVRSYLQDNVMNLKENDFIRGYDNYLFLRGSVTKNVLITLLVDGLRPSYGIDMFKSPVVYGYYLGHCMGKMLTDLIRRGKRISMGILEDLSMMIERRSQTLINSALGKSTVLLV